ncbi:MAG TPA: peptidylprolyl isomerase [Bacteroidales bacterium]|nr:peptidylprolyl isomerase [Bacteroidales bacterium]
MTKAVKIFMVMMFLGQGLLAQEPAVIDQVVAVVGRHVVLQSDIENQYLQMRMQQGIRGTAETMRCEILEDLLFQKLLLNQAELDSITVTDDQVEQEMERRLRYFISELGSQEKLEAFYNKTVVEIKNELRRLVKDQMIVEKVQADIMRKVVVTPQEVRRFFNNIPKDSIPMVPAEFEIAQIVKKPPITVEEKMATKERLNEYRKRILNGERFSTLALLYSEDPGSARRGGELGFYGRGELYPEFEAVAFRLREGEVSEIVETEAGFHILQLIERRGDLVNVRHLLLMTKVSVNALERAKSQLDSLALELRAGNINWDEAVEKFSEDPKKAPGGRLINPQTGGTRFDAATIDQQLSFVIDKLQPGEISDPVPMKTDDNKDAYRLLKLLERIPPHKANLRDDYNRIQQWALQEKQQKVLQQWVSNTLKNAYINIDPRFSQCDFEFSWTGKKH